MAATGDPVGQGFVASLARPGGNITGTSFGAGPEIESVFAAVHERWVSGSHWCTVARHLVTNRHSCPILTRRGSRCAGHHQETSDGCRNHFALIQTSCIIEMNRLVAVYLPLVVNAVRSGAVVHGSGATPLKSTATP